MRRARLFEKAVRMPQSIGPRFVIIQRGREDLDLTLSLRARFGAEITIMADKRVAERRRRTSVPIDVERRSGRDRRRATSEPEQWLWRTAGYRIVYRKRE